MSSELRGVEQLAPSTRIRFHCTGCGECCRHVSQTVPVDTYDIFHMAKFLRDHGAKVQDMDEFLNQYAEPATLDQCGYFCYFLKTKGPDASCIFLENSRCTIHATKPRPCRVYPFLVDPSPETERQFLLSHEREHHFRGETITPKAWMKHRISREDREFMDMDYGNAKRIAALLRQVPEGEKITALAHFYRLKFSEYDLDQPFMEQYRHNLNKLMGILNQLAQPSE